MNLDDPLCSTAHNMCRKCQHDFKLTPRQSAELLWSRFVNAHGLPGRNIPADLHMEHLNRVCKEAVRGLGVNKTDEAIVWVGNHQELYRLHSIRISKYMTTLQFVVCQLL